MFMKILEWFFGWSWNRNYEEWRHVSEPPNWRCRRGGVDYY